MESNVDRVESNDFINVIGIVFNNWTGLKLALEHGAGGTPVETRRKVENLVNSVYNLLSNEGDCYDIIDELEIVLDEQFCTIVEDNSCEEVSNELINLYGFWKTSNFDEVNSRMNSFKVKESILIPLSRIGSRNVSQRGQNDNDEEMEASSEQNGDDNMDEDSEWTVVEMDKSTDYNQSYRKEEDSNRNIISKLHKRFKFSNIDITDSNIRLNNETHMDEDSDQINRVRKRKSNSESHISNECTSSKNTHSNKDELNLLNVDRNQNCKISKYQRSDCSKDGLSNWNEMEDKKIPDYSQTSNDFVINTNVYERMDEDSDHIVNVRSKINKIFRSNFRMDKSINSHRDEESSWPVVGSNKTKRRKAKK